MQDVRSSNPYIKRVQYLGEINRLKRITIFLRTVQTLCDVDTLEHSRKRNLAATDQGEEVEERVFIEDCRQRLEAVAACQRYPEIQDDLLCRYLLNQALKASQRRVPLVGDCNRLRDIAKLYHDGTLKDVVTALVVSYVNDPVPGKASEGVNIVIALNQRNAIRVSGLDNELRKRIKTALRTLPKVTDKHDATRRSFLNEDVRSLVEKTEIPGWHCSYIHVNATDYAVYDDGTLAQLEDIFPSATKTHGGFYERTFLTTIVGELPTDQQHALGKFLRPKNFDGNIHNTIQHADTEDIYRVLLYLRRLKK